LVLTIFQIVDGIINVTTIVVSVVTIYFVIRQQMERIFSARVYLVTFFIGFTLAIVFNLVKDFFNSPALAIFYNEEGYTFLVLAGLMLSFVGYVALVKPRESTFSARFRSMFQHHIFPHLIGMSVAFFLALLIEGLMLVYRPFIISTVSLNGVIIYTVRIVPGFYELLIVGLIAFIAYPITMLIISAIRAKHTDERRAFLLLAIGSTAVGVASLSTSPLLPVIGLNAILLAHLVIAGTAIAYAYVFRSVSLYSELFESSREGTSSNNKGLGSSKQTFNLEDGRPLLLEVDSTADYSQVVKDLILEEIFQRQRRVYVFTFSASTLPRVLSNVADVTLYISTRSVSDPRPGSEPNRLLVPEHNAGIILNLLEKTIEVETKLKPLVIFDNLSDWLLTIGQERTARFLKEMLEIIGVNKNAASVFLIISNAQDNQMSNYVRTQFPRISICDASGILQLK
jgi:hypothetical protein